MKNLISSIGLFLFVVQIVVGQLSNHDDNDINSSVLLSSPSTAMLGRFGDYAAKNVYGAADISIPLLEYGSGELKETITLNYHTGGIKVRDRSGSVGLGWSLNAGGRIILKRNGEHDSKGYFNNASVCAEKQDEILNLFYSGDVFKIEEALQWSNYISGTSSGLGYYFDRAMEMNVPVQNGYDYMPDEYIVSAGKLAGKFVINKDLEPSYLDASNPCIIEDYYEYDSNGSIERIDGFNIINEKGNKYFFGNTGQYESNKPLYEVTEYRDYTLDEFWSSSFRSAFYLDKIEASDGGSSIQYHYVDGGTIKDYAVSHNITVDSPTNIGAARASQSVTHWTNYTRVLKEIEFPNGIIRFHRTNWKTGEETKVDSIEIFKIIAGDAVLTKRIVFNYGYFVNEDSSQCLKLDSVSIFDKNRNESYDYSFTYNPVKLPGRASTDIDHWGYYNGANNSGSLELENTTFLTVEEAGLVPRSTLIVQGVGSTQTTEVTLGPGNRAPNEEFSQACMLERVYYPTGGYSKFEYENHKKDDENIFGGLRVRRISNYTSNTATTPSGITEYSYEGGYLLGFDPTAVNAYARAYQVNGDCDYHQEVPTTTCAFFSAGRGVFQTQSTTAYTNVIETQVDGQGNPLGSTVYNYLESPDLTLSENHLVAPFLSRAIIREKASAILKYDNSDFCIKKTKYNYLTSNVNLLANGFTVSRNNYLGAGDSQFLSTGSICPYILDGDHHIKNYNFLTYDIHQFTRQLESKREVTYYRVDSEVDSLVTETSYTYNDSKHPYPIRIVSENSKNENMSTFITYPPDITNGEYTNMTGLNMINYPIEKVMKVDGNVVSGELITFKAINDNYSPDKKYILHTSEPLAEFTFFDGINKDVNYNSGIGIDYEVSYDKYDSYGNLLQYHKANQTYTSFIWGYNNTYPIIKADNAEYDKTGSTVDLKSSVSTALTATGYATLDAYLASLNFMSTNGSVNTTSINSWNSFMSSIKTNLPDAKIFFYTYDPLIGINSITDPRGQTTYYHYDEFNRLEAVTDANGNILNKNEYNYKQ